jgi:uncharacterized coiled-coil protein SlyX
MNKKRLEELQTKAKLQQSTLEDVIEIISESFISQSKHFNDLEKIINKRFSDLEKILQDNLNPINSPLYQVILDEDEDNDE